VAKIFTTEFSMVLEPAAMALVATGRVDSSADNLKHAAHNKTTHSRIILEPAEIFLMLISGAMLDNDLASGKANVAGVVSDFQVDPRIQTAAGVFSATPFAACPVQIPR
jgi:hypothetical protein